MRYRAKPVVVVASALASVMTASVASARHDGHQPRDIEKGLQVSVSVGAERISASEPLNVTVVLKNVSEGPISVLSHIATHETHLDWYRLRLEYLAPDGKGRCDATHARRVSRDIGIADGRDKSIPIVRTLAPDDSITHAVDLQAWASRRINGAMRIPPGVYQVSVVYKVTAGDGGFAGEKKHLWRGTVQSPRVPVTVTGPHVGDHCRPNPG